MVIIFGWLKLLLENLADVCDNFCKSIVKYTWVQIVFSFISVALILPFLYLDGGTQFTLKFWKEICGLFGTQFGFSAAYYPQTQGIVERM